MMGSSVDKWVLNTFMMCVAVQRSGNGKSCGDAKGLYGWLFFDYSSPDRGCEFLRVLDNLAGWVGQPQRSFCHCHLTRAFSYWRCPKLP